MSGLKFACNGTLKPGIGFGSGNTWIFRGPRPRVGLNRQLELELATRMQAKTKPAAHYFAVYAYAYQLLIDRSYSMMRTIVDRYYLIFTPIDFHFFSSFFFFDFDVSKLQRFKGACAISCASSYSLTGIYSICAISDHLPCVLHSTYNELELRLILQGPGIWHQYWQPQKSIWKIALWTLFTIASSPVLIQAARQ